MALTEGKDSAEQEDSPVIKQLKEIDDEYLAIEKEYETALNELTKKYDAKRKPFLDSRTKALIVGADDSSKTGTPALKGFWLQALKHHPAFDDSIQKWDEPVLEHLSDIQANPLDENDPNKGFKLTFHFVENPYFSNAELTVECHQEQSNPYNGEVDAKEIKASTINWNDGKDVTVRKVAKKVKGGGAKKAKAKAKETSESQQSFFGLFLNIKDGEIDVQDVMKILPAEAAEELEGLEDEELNEMIMEQIVEVFGAVQLNIVPYAVRWYTGEAAPQDSDDEEDDEEEDSEDDDDDESDDEPAPAPKQKGKVKKNSKKSPASSPETKPSDAPKEECKQQ